MRSIQSLTQDFRDFSHERNALMLDKLVADPGVGGVLFRPDRKEVVRRQFERVDHLAKIPLLKAANLKEGGAGILTDGTFFGNAIQIAATSDLTCTES